MDDNRNTSQPCCNSSEKASLRSVSVNNGKLLPPTELEKLIEGQCIQWADSPPPIAGRHHLCSNFRESAAYLFAQAQDPYLATFLYQPLGQGAHYDSTAPPRPSGKHLKNPDPSISTHNLASQARREPVLSLSKGSAERSSRIRLRSRNWCISCSSLPLTTANQKRPEAKTIMTVDAMQNTKCLESLTRYPPLDTPLDILAEQVLPLWMSSTTAPKWARNDATVSC